MKTRKTITKTFVYNRSNIDIVTVSSVLIGFLGAYFAISGVVDNSLPAAIAGGLLFVVAFHNFSKVMLLKKEEVIEEVETTD